MPADSDPYLYLYFIWLLKVCSFFLCFRIYEGAQATGTGAQENLTRQTFALLLRQQ